MLNLRGFAVKPSWPVVPLLGCLLLGKTMSAQLPRGAGLGHKEPGAPTLSGYLVNGRLLLPLKRFANDSGYEMSVSPSGRHVMVKVGSKISVLYDAKIAKVDGKSLLLPVEPIAMNNDVYVPIEFFEKAYPVRFSLNSKTRILTAELPGKTLKIPIHSLRGRS